MFGGMSAQEYIADKQKQYETEYENIVKESQKGKEDDVEEVIQTEL